MLVPVPSIGILIALLGPTEASGAASRVAQAGWVASKLWILLLPALWHRLVDGRRLRLPAPRRDGMQAACITGLLFVVAIAMMYFLVGGRWIDVAAARARIAASGLDRPGLYLAMAVYWCTINSLLEEYVWRWFVFTRCQAVLSRGRAVVAAGLFFTMHHTIALAVFFADAKVVALASIGIWIAGATWAWIYLRSRNIYAAYVSHVFADVVIFWIGYRIVFGSG